MLMQDSRRGGWRLVQLAISRQKSRVDLRASISACMQPVMAMGGQARQILIGLNIARHKSAKAPQQGNLKGPTPPPKPPLAPTLRMWSVLKYGTRNRDICLLTSM